MKRQYIFFLISGILLASSFIFIELINVESVIKFRKYYALSVIDPLNFLFLYIFVTSGLLLFFNDNIFGKWLKYIVTWYAPLALILIISGSTGSSFSWPLRADLAIIAGQGLVAITLVFALVQRYYFKSK